jgi:hypothetical protein
VLPVYIRSNIDKVWVAGIPEQFQTAGEKIDKVEIPIAHLELDGSRAKAEKRALVFAADALTYAETLQDGLPIRKSADNSANRVYRLKLGEIIKILQKVEGQPAISTTGDPLPGAWYEVLTEDGTTGYCFSYRLRLFQWTGGPLEAQSKAVAQAAPLDNSAIDAILAEAWYPDTYGAMVDSGEIDVEALLKDYRFMPGQDLGLARIYTEGLDKTFSYTGLKPGASPASWQFEGSSLMLTERSPTTIALQYNEDNGIAKTLLFVTLPRPLDDIIVQECARRASIFNALASQASVYTSANYGTLTLTPNPEAAGMTPAPNTDSTETMPAPAEESGQAAWNTLQTENKFSWQGYSLLVPSVIPVTSLGTGRVDMGLYIDDSLKANFNGAFAFDFAGVGGKRAQAVFLYSQDTNGLRLEYVPSQNIQGIKVMSRASSPVIIYFSRSSRSGQ